ncbi:hypothetical protein EOD42_23860 [Rhodovarius crocodyli]|uniref:DoxX family protein n=1 Tax=Rhodovarius crocodyli TaxID=1979269 RepID=A0A437LXF7_9PROT|nr:hypothetical protein [Rhodovarius crocodyli]RVT90070.1 hypothetical protein EOD42_23860 [Rhodovarius crocodyli]
MHPTLPFGHPRLARAVSWLAAGWIAWEFFYYEQFKLNGAEGSVQGVFQPLADWLFLPAHEAAIRWTVALLEIAAATLVLNQPSRLFGAFMTMGLMGGAIFLHTLGPIGIDPYGDGAVLFKEACFTFLVAGFLVWLHRREIPALLPARLVRA